MKTGAAYRDEMRGKSTDPLCFFFLFVDVSPGARPRLPAGSFMEQFLIQRLQNKRQSRLACVFWRQLSKFRRNEKSGAVVLHIVADM